MARYERGIYEPEDEIRVFDGSEDDEDAEGSRLPLLIVLALLVLAMFAGVVWLAYTQGVVRGRTETPLLTAQAGVAKPAPENPAGGQMPYKGFKIYEQPAPADDEADAAAAVQPPVTPTASAAAQSAAPQMTAPTGVPTVLAPRTEVAEAPAGPPPMKKSVLTSTPSVAKPVASKPIGPATAPPKQLAVPTTQVTSTAPAPAAGNYTLQIGAYKSQDDASAAWHVYQSKHALLLTGYSQDVQRADLGDKGVWYRLRIAGFASKDVADAMCDRLKADGGACIPAK